MPTESDRLQTAIEDLVSRGLLQFDRAAQLYDLHPVIRGLVAGQMGSERREAVGAPLIDHFNAKTTGRVKDARSLEDLTVDFNLQRILLSLGRYEEGFDLYKGDFSDALLLNLDAVAECQALLRFFFPAGWRAPPILSSPEARSYLYNDAAIALLLDDPDLSEFLYGQSIEADLAAEDELELCRKILNVASHLCGLGRLAPASRLTELAEELADAAGHAESIFRAALSRYWIAARVGAYDDADRLWEAIQAMGTEWTKAAYRQGDAEYFRAQDMFRRGCLDDATLTRAEGQASGGWNHLAIEGLAQLRGRWHLAGGEVDAAARSLANAVSMARTAGRTDSAAEAWWILARIAAGHGVNVEGEVNNLVAAEVEDPELALPLAEIWHKLGNDRRAIELALAAHVSATAEGIPYVWRAELDHAQALLKRMGIEWPAVRQHDPENLLPFDWEPGVRAFARRLLKSPQRN